MSNSDKPTVSPVSESMMFRDQSTIADAVGKEVEWLENISNIYSAGKVGVGDTEKEIKKHRPKLSSWSYFVVCFSRRATDAGSS